MAAAPGAGAAAPLAPGVCHLILLKSRRGSGEAAAAAAAEHRWSNLKESYIYLKEFFYISYFFIFLVF